MEEVLGVKPLEFTDEEDDGAATVAAVESDPLRDILPAPMSPKSSLNSITQQDIRFDFAHIMEANKNCSVSIAKGNSITLPMLRSGNMARNLESTFDKSEKEKAVKITMEDIEEEIAYWKSSIVYYVLGANPPLSVLDGFVRRIWIRKIDKVGLLSYGVFLIRFDTMEHRDEVINGGFIFFNKRPVIMKAWDPNTNFKKEDIRTVPIWVHLTNLE
uniref:DUF4283 domain-containing protein n=1 Tax=Cannabis sativa TaxID=3483 RepID=A0A803QDX8_CANSA